MLQAPVFPETLLQSVSDPDLKRIAEKVLHQERITEEECLVLFEKAELNYLGMLANYVRERLHGRKTYFNRNFHIEPTNVCMRKYDGEPVTEVHIVGGVHPKMNLDFFCDLLSRIRDHRPDLHRKGFTAVELDYMIRKAKLSLEDGMRKLKDAGLQSLPGGGAEIFAAEVRAEICPDKVDGPGWLDIHRTAHQLGMHSNATMLYGHVERYAHRVDHMSQLRKLQDETSGFNCFIPLKFRSGDNDLSHLGEVSVMEDLKLYAIARIFMDNMANLKAYWPMLGRQTAQLTLEYGVNDLDGTIDDTTRIYSMAGSEEQTPAMNNYAI
jgi:aminodeoxyfutalosine synthase